MLLLLSIIFLQSIVAYDVTTLPNNSETFDVSDVPKSASETPVSTTELDGNKTILVERITQPSQTQQIERTLVPSPGNNSLKVASKKESNLENFRPSPQLETYYEYNKFPVKPVIGEARTSGGFGNSGYFLNSWTERPLVPPWTENHRGQWSDGVQKPNSWNEHTKHQSNTWVDRPTTQQAWVSKVKFPTTSHGSSNEGPYNFAVNNEKSLHYPSVNFPATTEGFSFNRPVETPLNKRTKPLGSFWDKFLGIDANKKKNPETIQKTFSDYNLLEKPPLHSLSKEPEYGLSGESNSWHKVIKFLTTIIPIGLLISALTPTIITVSAVNDTQSRYRSEESLQQGLANRLASSLNYMDTLSSNNCRDKVLCELLMSASASKDSERHIENLLSTFTENEDLKSKKEDLLKVFEAVKNENCSSILCRRIKHPT